MAWRRRQVVSLRAEQFEDRVTPAVLNAYEASALQIINQLRANPATFAADLNLLYHGGAHQSPSGYAANDPIWTDLRADINSAESRSSWRSGFNSAGANTFLAVASALPARAPLVWESAMQDGAAGHNQWMYTNVYAHSVFTQGAPPSIGESPSFPIPGIPRNFSVTAGDFFNYIGLGLNGAGENISYSYNDGGATYQAYRNGQISLDGYYQRLVYADVIGFMMEYNNGSPSSPWGHLQNLTGNYNILGLSTLLYENPVESNMDGVSQSYFSTHRLGLRSSVSYANLVVYLDSNSNNVYDAGEGLAGQVTFNFGAGSQTLPATGYGAVQLPPSGTYNVSATYLGNALGTQQVVADGTNRTVAFRVTSLVDSTPPTSQVSRLPVFDSNPNFLVQWSGTDNGGSGVANYDVYVSIDGGAFTRWLAATTQTQATYAGTLGHRYAFYSVATDNAGLRQATLAGGQASTELRSFEVAAPSNLVAIASALSHSDESFTAFINHAYSTYLGRNPGASEVTFWLGRMRSGATTDEQLEAQFVGSPEYIATHGGAGAGWVTGMYQDLLGRTPGPAEVAFWVAQLNANVPATTIALGFAAGAEREGLRVAQNYQTYLGRLPSAVEVASWVDQFINHGMTTETMAASFVGSREFFNNPAKGSSTPSVWVDQAYRAILGRPASGVEIANRLPQLNVPANIGAFASQVTHSNESYTRFITSAYNTYLGRGPDPVGLAYWLDRMTRGVTTDEQLEAQFIGSPEYIANHGGSGAGWVSSMYVDLLGRPAGPTELSFWVGRLNAGVAPTTIAFGFAASAEREGIRVRQNYANLLGRPPSQPEVDSWVNQFVNHGMTSETMIAGFAGSPEYFRNVVKGNGNVVRWLDALFADVYHRPITLAEINALASTIQ
jgi:hypothetical protein